MVYVLLIKSVMSYCFVGFALAIREPLFLKVLASNFWSQSFFSKYWQLCLREPLHAHPWYLDRKVILVSSLDMLGLRRRQASAELPLSSLYELLDEGLEEVVNFVFLCRSKRDSRMYAGFLGLTCAEASQACVDSCHWLAVDDVPALTFHSSPRLY